MRPFSISIRLPLRVDKFNREAAQRGRRPTRGGLAVREQQQARVVAVCSMLVGSGKESNLLPLPVLSGVSASGMMQSIGFTNATRELSAFPRTTDGRSG